MRSEYYHTFVIFPQVIHKKPNPPIEETSVVPVSAPNTTLNSKKIKALARVTSVGPSGKLPPHVVYLTELGMELEVIKEVTRKFPAFAYYSLEGKVKPVVEFLLDLGVPKSDIPTILSKRPQLCGISLSENLIPTMTFLENLGVDKKQWAKVFYRFPALVTYSRQKLKATVDFLYEMGLSAESVGKILTRCPNIISYSVEDKLRPTAEYFHSMGVDVALLLHRCPQTFGLSPNPASITRSSTVVGLSTMSNLDMSLDDIIKMNKKSGGGANTRGRARNSGPGPVRRLSNRSANRTTPYSVGKVQAPDTAWQHDMFADHAVAAAGYPSQVGRVYAIETGTKLLISNLDYGVSNEDIKELFSEAGDLKRYSIHYDRSGRSKGTAEVVYSRRKDAEAAVKRYNNVQLDGKPMKIEIVGTNIATPAALPPSTNGMYGDQNGASRSQGRGGAIGRPRGGARGGFRRGRGRGRGRGEKVSAEDLDADLEKYHTEAMETN